MSDIHFKSQVSVPRKWWQRHAFLRAQDDENTEHSEHGKDKKPFQQFVVVHMEGEGELIWEIDPILVNQFHQHSSRSSYSYRWKFNPMCPRAIKDLVLLNRSLSLVVTGNQQTYLWLQRRKHWEDYDIDHDRIKTRGRVTYRDIVRSLRAGWKPVSVNNLNFNPEVLPFFISESTRWWSNVNPLAIVTMCCIISSLIWWSPSLEWRSN